MGGAMTPAETSVADVLLWIVGLSTLLSFATAAWTVFSGPSRKNAALIDALKCRIDDQDKRLSTVEQAQITLPKSGDIHQLELAMTRLQGEMKTMSVAMQGQSNIMERLETIVGRHENHLLDGSGRK
jgi:TolA-binding protein